MSLALILIKETLGIEIGTKGGILQLNGSHIIALVGRNRFNLVLSQTWDSLLLAGDLVQHLYRNLGVYHLTNKQFVVTTAD